MGDLTTHGFLYKPAQGSTGAAEKALYDAGQDRVDTRLGRVIYVGDPDYATLAAAIAACNALGTSCTLVVPVGTHTIASNVTVNSAVALVVEMGGLITVDTGHTLTINGTLAAGLYQVFTLTGTGKVTFTTGSKIKSSWFASLTDAVACLNTTSAELEITKAETISADTILATTTKVTNSSGSVLTIATGVTVTINGTLAAGRHQIFSWTGTGTVVYGNLVPEVYPEWYGAVPDNSTDSTLPLQKALDTHTVLHLGRGIYKITTELYPKEAGTIYGEGPASIIYRSTTTGGSHAAGLCPYNYVTLRNFTLRGSGAAYVAGANGITVLYNSGGWTDPGGVVGRSHTNMALWRGAHLTLENVIVEDWAANGMGAGPWSVIKDAVIRDCLNEGMLLPGAYCQIINPTITGCLGWGIDINTSYTQVLGGLIYNCGDETSYPSDMGGIIIASHTQSAGTVGNKVIGTTIDTSDGPAILVYAPTGFDYALTDTILESITIKNVQVDAAGDIAAIAITDLSTSGTKLDRVVVNNVTINKVTTGHGIRVFGARNIVIDNYHIYDVPGRGIMLFTGTGAWEGVTIGKGSIKSFATHGIYAFGGSKLTIAGYDISDSTAIVAYFGILLQNVTKFNIGQGVVDLDVTNGEGIRLTGTTGRGKVSGANVANCLVGIYDNSTGDYNSYIGNDVSDTNTTPMTLAGTTTNYRVQDNIGYLTNNGGTSAAIATGGIIAHGLVAAPTICGITPVDIAVTGCAVTADATNLTVTWTGGAGPYAFRWFASVYK